MQANQPETAEWITSVIMDLQIQSLGMFTISASKSIEQLVSTFSWWDDRHYIVWTESQYLNLYLGMRHAAKDCNLSHVKWYLTASI
jgi:hypothetical protein